MAIPKMNCNINNLLLGTIALLVVIFTNDIFTTVPVMKNLFTDNINFGLLIVLALLILFLDIPSGIVFTFMIIYVAVYLRLNKPGRQNFTDVLPSPSEPSLDAVLGESEFSYDHSKPAPVINLPPFMPKSSDEIKASSRASAMPCEEPRLMVPVDKPNKNAYDVVGCRYDYQDKEQNQFMNGPPLASCGAYSNEQFQKVGTLFYPLNA